MWNDGTCTHKETGPTAGDLVPGRRGVEKKKKKVCVQIFFFQFATSFLLRLQGDEVAINVEQYTIKPI